MAKTGLRIVKDTVSTNMKTIARRWPREAMAVLGEEGERLLDITGPFVPSDQGILRGSGFVDTPRTDLGGNISVKVGYGRPAEAYAAAQHEGPGSSSAPPSWSGKTALSYTTSGTGPKYLERGLKILNGDHLIQMRRKLALRVARISLKK